MRRWPCIIFICTGLMIVGRVSSYGEEEKDCVKPDWFRCANGRCLSHWFLCNGDDDCDDATDEENCPDKPNEIKNVTCSTDQYQCADNYCIWLEDFCDNKFDCPDESDEYAGCGDQKNCSEFRCKNGYCMRQQWVCDGFNDCGDFSDESDCGDRAIPPEKCDNQINRYLCDHGRCISLNSTCNGYDDCGDDSDENEDSCRNAEKSCSEGIGCSHYCKKTPKGAACSCPSGYELVNNQTCADIDECSENVELCDQRCINNAGSYSCICEVGYELQEDKKTCKVRDGAEALLVFTTKREIRGLYIESEVYFPIVQNLQHALGVSVDADHVYWSDIKSGDEAIMRSRYDGMTPEVIVTAGLGLPEDIAVDWVTGNVYFTDSLWKRIGVCKSEGEYCAVIVSESLDMPRGLALYPLNGEMYWSDFGEKPHISRAGMDGKGGERLVSEDLEWPNGLAIDYPSRRLYWVDAKRQTVESIRLDGGDRRQVFKTFASHPYAIAVYEDKLYWSDWRTKTIQSAHKYSGKNRSTLVREVDLIYGVDIYHSALKPRVPNPCDTQPCSQLCLLGLNRTHSCACTLDTVLSDDERTCISVKKRQHLVIAFEDTFLTYYHEILGNPRVTGSTTLKRISQVAYDSTTKSIIANDRTSNSLFRFDLETEEVRRIVDTGSRFVGGMDFDEYAKNIYWSDSRRSSIQVYSLQTGEKTVLHFAEEPLDILAVPEHAVLYVVFKSAGKYHIEKIETSGAGDRERVVQDLRGPKISLAYDPEFDRIFWSDEGSGRIEILPVRSNDRSRFRTGLRRPVSLAVVDQQVFWTLRDSKHLQWADKGNRLPGVKGVTLRVKGQAQVLLLAGTARLYAEERPHVCRLNNGGCSHVCLAALSDLRACACPPAMNLSPDNRTCDLQIPCASGQIRCSDASECIDETRRCNGVPDCPNGEDEYECARVNSCGAGEFMCRNGQCIGSTNRCNSIPDCHDRSDEVNCDEEDCKEDEFQCLDGRCIKKFYVCDGHNDCNDFSDETECRRHVCEAESFRCTSGACIPKSWECDGENDCQDGSDEAGANCHAAKCPGDMFRCENKRCLDLTLVCNSLDDCGDNSDEVRCSKEMAGVGGQCTENEYKCRGTEECIPTKLRCDGKQDCPKNDDEHRCAQCEPNEFACDNEKCIDRSWVCDRVNDCGDESDEVHCDEIVRTSNDNVTVAESVDCDEFTCRIGGCLTFEKVCDGTQDCFDGSDEDGECSTACKDADVCKQLCQKTPTGALCLCQKGYTLDSDERSCVDVDECKLQVCPQICHNQPGSFTCSCFEGFLLRGNRVSCKVIGEPMEIITATKTDIRRVSLSLNSIAVLHRQPNVQITGLDVNMRKKTIYWSNELLGTVNQLNTETSEFKLVSGLGRPGALALNWATDNVYFHDGEKISAIKVCNLEAQKCAQIIPIEGSAKPMAIAVDPLNGFLFWGQTTFEIFEQPEGEIYRTDLSGADLRCIAHERIGVVSGITVDHRRLHLYWADANLQVIERSDLDGNNREIFLKQHVDQPLSINIYDDSVYWLVGTSGVLKKCSLFGNNLCELINLKSSNVNQFFVISQISRQPNVENTCRNHECEYMCVMKKHKSTCICPNGVLVNSNSTCDSDAIASDAVQFPTTMLGMGRTNVRIDGGLFTGIFITVAVGIVAGAIYRFYKKKKSSSPNTRNVSVSFQNPSFGRSSATVVTNDFILPIVSPGEHEYTNPMTEAQQTEVETITIADVKACEVSSEDLNDELEKGPCSHSSLIS
ncbi:vitellogenin receptor-like isoform X2 [Venturia canescens]|uniref:vitellogenin receptor-like isoform X2 n=1 Tax=Venturia canescens TaxID=32260 RepID=UPI001C9C91FB|nr:vitellogenin receptor-like isoform X2 [Venturia canescens]XP_043277983.1 vitellogenin receptor-like isoform X2 [Venturia canescens]